MNNTIIKQGNDFKVNSLYKGDFPKNQKPILIGEGSNCIMIIPKSLKFPEFFDRNKVYPSIVITEKSITKRQAKSLCEKWIKYYGNKKPIELQSVMTDPKCRMEMSEL